MKVYKSEKEAEKDVVNGALNINDLNIQFWGIDATGLESKAIDTTGLKEILDNMALSIICTYSATDAHNITPHDMVVLEIKALLNAKVLAVKEKMLSIYALIQKLLLLK